MTNSPHASLAIGHPAPARDRADPRVLGFALAGAPAAWMAQLLFGFAATSYFCWAGTRASSPAWLDPAIVSLNILALVVAVAALATAVRLIRRTAHEHRGSGSLLDAGEGRTRFLAMWSACTAMVFLVAIVATTLCLPLVTLCRE